MPKTSAWRTRKSRPLLWLSGLLLVLLLTACPPTGNGSQNKSASVEFSPAQLTPQIIADFAAAMNGPGPMLAYCRSGTRSTTLWALAQAQSGAMSVDQILAAARAAGYDLDQHRSLLAGLADQS
mgnify:CR=1 FL=1